MYGRKDGPSVVGSYSGVARQPTPRPLKRVWHPATCSRLSAISQPFQLRAQPPPIHELQHSQTAMHPTSPLSLCPPPPMPSPCSDPAGGSDHLLHWVFRPPNFLRIQEVQLPDGGLPW